MITIEIPIMVQVVHIKLKSTTAYLLNVLIGNFISFFGNDLNQALNPYDESRSIVRRGIPAAVVSTSS